MKITINIEVSTARTAMERRQWQDVVHLAKEAIADASHNEHNAAGTHVAGVGWYRIVVDDED